MLIPKIARFPTIFSNLEEGRMAQLKKSKQTAWPGSINGLSSSLTGCHGLQSLQFAHPAAALVLPFSRKLLNLTLDKTSYYEGTYSEGGRVGKMVESRPCPAWLDLTMGHTKSRPLGTGNWPQNVRRLLCQEQAVANFLARCPGTKELLLI